METHEVVALHEHQIITRDEARQALGFGVDPVSGSTLEEAERVLRVVSGWNPARVSTAEAIKPAIDYFDAKEVPDLG